MHLSESHLFSLQTLVYYVIDYCDWFSLSLFLDGIHFLEWVVKGNFCSYYFLGKFASENNLLFKAGEIWELENILESEISRNACLKRM